MKKSRKPNAFDADAVVIGAGAAGLVSSIIFAGGHGEVVLIEQDKMGGDCLNTGCIPSKSLIRSARLMFDLNRASEFGIEVGEKKLNFGKVMERIEKVIKSIEPHDSPERLASLGVKCIKGSAKIESPYLVSVNGKTISTRTIIVATGASPMLPPIHGLESVDFLTSESVWNLKSLPKRLLVIGAGPIGCELAQAFCHLGAQVVQLDLKSRLLPREDLEVSDLVRMQFQKDGISVLTEHEPVKMGREADQNYLEALHKGQVVRIEFDRVLIAAGRKSNVEGIGLEKAGVKLNSAGAIQVNSAMQTNIRNIFACGDVAGPYQYTHMASYQAFFASINAMLSGFWRIRANHRVVPWATYVTPEVARVGVSEIEARELDICYEVTNYELSKLDRARTDGESQGFIKILTVPKKDKILGVTIVGHQAGELIGEFVLAMTHNMGLKKIIDAIHVYPTMYEANKLAAHEWRKNHLPKKYVTWAKRFFEWRRSGK